LISLHSATVLSALSSPRCSSLCVSSRRLMEWSRGTPRFGTAQHIERVLEHVADEVATRHHPSVHKQMRQVGAQIFRLEKQVKEAVQEVMVEQEEGKIKLLAQQKEGWVIPLFPSPPCLSLPPERRGAIDEGATATNMLGSPRPAAVRQARHPRGLCQHSQVSRGVPFF
jgi:hypothetical protein